MRSTGVTIRSATAVAGPLVLPAAGPPLRDHGGGIDAAVARFGGTRAGWMDLSTGINPEPYPLPALPLDAWTALPDSAAMASLSAAARSFWSVPEGADIVAAPGASALIARLPLLAAPGVVAIPGPTYNEHAAAFRFHGWSVSASADTADTASARVVVHPNNPDGRHWPCSEASPPLEIIDESFCDICPGSSRIAETTRPGTVVLKSFGKFWGLAGLRLGFAIGTPQTVGVLRDHLGPWPVAGPALAIGAAALADVDWADATRTRLARDAERLDAMLAAVGAEVVGGTTLFRLYRHDAAAELQNRLAKAHIWTRAFPYAADWLRLGLPPAAGWHRLERALA